METLRLADGRALSARRWHGTGPETLVILHGLLDSAEGWETLGAHVRGTVIAFDLPGFGASDVPGRGSIAGYASDVVAGLKQLGVGQFTLLGHSLGGAVATAVAESMPSAVSALVLLAPAGFGRIGLAEVVSVPGVREIVQVALPFALSSRLAVRAGYVTMIANGRAPEREIVDRVTSRGGTLVPGAREATRAVVHAGRDNSAFHRRRVDYPGPVFAVWGDRDRLVPVAHRHGVRHAFPHARIDVWPGMGHHPLRERYEDLTVLVDEAPAAHTASPRPPLADAA